VEVGTLILDDVNTLTMQEQTQLFDWLNAASPRPRLISTSPHPLFPRVERGLFKEALYYRLNVIRMEIDSPTS
jgi:DNA-binding NtrC family response regulator